MLINVLLIVASVALSVAGVLLAVRSAICARRLFREVGADPDNPFQYHPLFPFEKAVDEYMHRTDDSTLVRKIYVFGFGGGILFCSGAGGLMWLIEHKLFCP